MLVVSQGNFIGVHDSFRMEELNDEKWSILDFSDL